MGNSEEGFCDQLRHIIERGLMAGLSGGAFKNYMLSVVHEYSKKIGVEGEQTSALFQSLCDLMLDGYFARMPENALKLYVILNIYRYSENEKQELKSLREMSGLSVHDVKQAMEYLRASGRFISAEEKRLNNRA